MRCYKNGFGKEYIWGRTRVKASCYFLIKVQLFAMLQEWFFINRSRKNLRVLQMACHLYEVYIGRKCSLQFQHRQHMREPRL
jgi:hypothetical protein